MAGIESDPIRDVKTARKIFNRLDQINPIVRIMLEFSARTGLRYIDVSTLKFSDVMINGVVRERIEVIQQKIYSGHITKGATPAQARKKAKLNIALSKPTAELIKEVSEIQNSNAVYLFESNYYASGNKPYTSQYANKLLKVVAKELKLNFQLSTHSFRKTFVMQMLDSGAKINQCQAALGHASAASTDNYIKSFAGDVDDLVRGINY